MNPNYPGLLAAAADTEAMARLGLGKYRVQILPRPGLDRGLCAACADSFSGRKLAFALASTSPAAESAAEGQLTTTVAGRLFRLLRDPAADQVLAVTDALCTDCLAQQQQLVLAVADFVARVTPGFFF